MKISLRLIFWGLTILFVNSVFAARYSNIEFNPAEAKKIQKVNVLAVNMTMGMGKIRDTLKTQGFNVKCNHSGCLVRENGVFFSANYKKDRFDKSPMGENIPPTFISHRLNGAHSKNCTDMLSVVKLFCTKGENNFPCIKSRNTIVVNVKPRRASNDGWLYSLNAKVDPSTGCKIILKRQQVTK